MPTRPPVSDETSRRARALDDRFRVIFDNVNDGILVIAADSYEFIDANPRLCSMFGYTHAEMLGLDTATLSADRRQLGAAERERYRDRAKAGEALVVEWRCRTKEGLGFWAEIAVRLASFEGRQVFLLTAHDISKRRRAQDELAYYDRIVHAITAGIADLAAGSSLPIAMASALKTVGEALDVDRIVVFAGMPSLTSLDDSIAFTWVRPGMLRMPGVEVPEADQARQLADWLAPLTRGETVFGYAGDATGFLDDLMQALGARSILAVPIEVEGAYWGHIALENCRRPRAWAKREIDAVGILARVTGAVMTRRKAQDALAESEEQFRAVSDTVIDAIIMFRADGTVAYWNHAAERILGYTAAEAHGKSIADWMTPPRFRDESRRMMQAFTDPGHGPFSGTTFERAAIRKDGVEIAVELSISALSVGAQRYGVEVLRDITNRKAAEAAVVRMASHDALTGLPNRRFFIEALKHEIARAKRTGKLLAVLYLDLDRFKDVNDTLGHPIGDRLLQEVAGRLRASMRAIDTIARFGGDEFAAMGIDIAAAADVGALARKIVAALGAPFAVDDRTIQTGASIGIAVYGPDSPDAESLLSHADIALYRAKGERRGTYRFYTEAMDAEVRARIAIDSQLTEAIARQQFVVMYQPQVAVDSGRIAGLEALVRWQHPTRGLIGPGEFIVAAERSGAIVALGRFVQTEACLQMQRWIDAGIAPPLIGVNVSGVQFKAPNELVDGITSVLAQSGLAPHLVELELTESVLMEASLEHSTALQHLREMGLRIAIDHFGTGYSSLDYLRRFRVDRIKIPGSFITDVCSDASVASIVRAAIGLARELEVELVVEGVETAEQLALLKGWGCRVVQGFYFSKPLDVDGATSLLRAGIVTPAKA